MYYMPYKSKSDNVKYASYDMKNKKQNKLRN